MYDARESWSAYITAADLMQEQTGSDSNFPLIRLKISDPEGTDFNTDIIEFEPNAAVIETELNKYRYDEYIKYVIETKNGLRFECVYSIQKLTKVYAVISLSRMVFVTVLMAISVLFF